MTARCHGGKIADGFVAVRLIQTSFWPDIDSPGQHDRCETASSFRELGASNNSFDEPANFELARMAVAGTSISVALSAY